MEMNVIQERFANQARAIRGLVQGVSEDLAHWKPDPDSWSMVEVINHLFDEERQDFRVRLDYALHHPDLPWPGIDPEGWVIERQYNLRSLEDSLRDFELAREESLAWLQGLESPDWQAVYEAPFGPIRAGDILAAWLAHDLLHLRQLVELQRAYTERLAEPYQLDYAGSWDDPTTFTLEDAHREFGKRTNGRVWELLETAERSAAEDAEMLHAAHTSLYHWLHAGTGKHHQRGEWMIARVHVVLGQAAEAQRHARRCLDLTEEHAGLLEDFDFAFAYEGMARTHALAGNQAAAREYLARAQAAGEAIADAEDREIFFGDFNGGEWYGVRG